MRSLGVACSAAPTPFIPWAIGPGASRAAYHRGHDRTHAQGPIVPVRFGLQLWSQSTDWPTFRDAAVAADGAGWDSIWTWDHLLAIFGPWEQPIFEGWTALAALGPLTDRARLGLMVGANTFRNPGLTAKLATTLDHVSSGRAVLGIGGAWFEREHDAFGIDFGASPGERLGWLDESVTLLRRLLDGERVDPLVPQQPRHPSAVPDLLLRPFEDVQERVDLSHAHSPENSHAPHEPHSQRAGELVDDLVFDGLWRGFHDDAARYHSEDQRPEAVTVGLQHGDRMVDRLLHQGMTRRIQADRLKCGRDGPDSLPGRL